MRLNTRMLLFILSTFFLVFAAGIGYISFRFRVKAMKDATAIAKSYTRENAKRIQAEMDKDFSFSRSMAQAMVAIEDHAGKKREFLQYEILRNALKNDTSYIASFLQWDLSDCDSQYTKEHGRRRYLCFRNYLPPSIKGYVQQEEMRQIDTMYGLVDTADYDYFNPYYIVKREHCEYIINPYFYSYQNVKEMPSAIPTQEDAILETTIIIPIIADGKFRALCGVDIPLNHFNDLISSVQPFEESESFILSNNAAYVTHKDVAMLTKPIVDHIYTGNLSINIEDSIRQGKELAFRVNDPSKGRIVLHVFSHQDGKHTIGLGHGHPCTGKDHHGRSQQEFLYFSFSRTIRPAGFECCNLVYFQKHNHPHTGNHSFVEETFERKCKNLRKTAHQKQG
jgi:hypothetical protein